MRQRRRLVDEIADELRELISREFAPGQRLPAEKDLAVTLDVSRNTLREALLRLWNEGILERRWGVGTFVRERGRPVVQNFTDFVTMKDAIERGGKTAAIEHVSIRTVPCPEEIADALEVSADTEVWRAERTFTADEMPVATFIEWMRTEANGAPVDLKPLADISVPLLTLLRDTTGTEITRMEAQLVAVSAADPLTRMLDVAVGAPLLKTQQVSLDEDGETVLYSELYYRPDGMSLHVVRTPRF